MKVADKEVIVILNKVLKNELSAINQYFLHSRIYQNWGLSKLAAKEYEEALGEMRHADSVIQRILFLESLPNLQDLAKLKIGEDIKEMLQCDLALEQEALVDLRQGIVYCVSVQDFVSRDLLAAILQSEEEHVDWLETQLDLLERLGPENYAQSQT